MKKQKKNQKNSVTPKKKHVHSFAITRGLFNAKTGVVSGLDMECECGFKMFVQGNFSWHRHWTEHELKITDLQS